MKQTIKLHSLVGIIALVLLTSCTKNEVTNITTDKFSAELFVGQTDSITAIVNATGDLDQPITWTSSNTAVATIKESVIAQTTSKTNNVSTIIKKGVITGVSAGSATITVQAGSKTTTFDVKINSSEVTSITLNKSTLKLTIAQSYLLVSKINNSDNYSNTQQTWTTSDTAVAMIEDGKVTALSTGTATITVQAGKKTATCVVTVDDKINPIFTKGILAYYGDYFKMGLSKNFVVYLVNATDTLLLDFNADSTAINTLPAGIYNVPIKLNFLPNTLNPILSDGTNYFGSWYSGVDNNNPIADGNVTVSLASNIYSIEYNLLDLWGNTISGTFKGTLSYYDGTIQQAPSAVKSISNVKRIKAVSKNMIFKRKFRVI